MIAWERLKSDQFHVWRAKVPGGWLVTVRGQQEDSVTFYTDPNHHWNGRSLP